VGYKTTSAQVSALLLDELRHAMENPNDIFGYARYGNGVDWSQLDMLSGGIQPFYFGVLAARPKVGKTQLACALIPHIAAQADLVGLVVKVITLETTTLAYQRRMAAVMAKIADPMDIRRGKITENEQQRYVEALAYIASLPIEYLSMKSDLTFEQSMVPGYSGVSVEDVIEFVRDGDNTFYWVLDHLGLLRGIQMVSDVYTSINDKIDKLTDLSHLVTSGMVITHVNRASVGGKLTLASLSHSDKLGQNADIVLLLDRPMMDKELTEEDVALFDGREPGWMGVITRNENTGVVPVRWHYTSASYSEYVTSPEIPLPGIVVPSKSSVKRPEKRGR